MFKENNRVICPRCDGSGENKEYEDKKNVPSMSLKERVSSLSSMSLKEKLSLICSACLGHGQLKRGYARKVIAEDYDDNLDVIEELDKRGLNDG